MSSETLLPTENDLFAGRYRPISLLGKGGMGQVYLVEDTVLDNEQVALKILKKELTENENHKARFLREVKLARQVTHPNVVRTYDVGVHDDQLYYTMEHVEGLSIRDIIKSQGHFSPEEIQIVLPQLCEGLSAIHDLEIVHRDLKPANVIITKNNEVKIADFGIARPGTSELTHGDEIIGSSHYMAPEIWVGKELSSATDVYALGVVLFEMATGVTPFEAENPAELMWKHLEATPVKPSEIQPSVPSWLDDLTHALLAKDDIHRPCNALEIADFTKRITAETELRQTGDFLAPATDEYDAVTGTVVDETDFTETDLRQSFIDQPEEDLLPSDIDESVPRATNSFEAVELRARKSTTVVNEFEEKETQVNVLQSVKLFVIALVFSLAGIWVVTTILPNIFRSLGIFLAAQTGNRSYLFFTKSWGDIAILSACLALPLTPLRSRSASFSRMFFYTLSFFGVLFFSALFLWVLKAAEGTNVSPAVFFKEKGERLFMVSTLSIEYLFSSITKESFVERLSLLVITLFTSIWLVHLSLIDTIKHINPTLKSTVLRGMLFIIAIGIISVATNFTLSHLGYEVYVEQTIPISGTQFSVPRSLIVSGAVSWLSLYLLSSGLLNGVFFKKRN